MAVASRLMCPANLNPIPVAAKDHLSCRLVDPAACGHRETTGFASWPDIPLTRKRPTYVRLGQGVFPSHVCMSLPSILRADPAKMRQWDYLLMLEMR
jgi:hypothetical protein